LVAAAIISGVVAVTIESSFKKKQKTALGVTQDTDSLEDRRNNMVQVMAGGGNTTLQYMAFFPLEVSVNVGQRL
jgi:hypothetical protein